MPQSLAQLYVQLVFSTKERRPYLRDDAGREHLMAYMATILRDHVDSPSLTINGVEDHIHALLRLSRRYPMMKVVQAVKAESSRWLKRQAVVSSGFAWQAGYGAFSVSASCVEATTRYIQNQKEHHQRFSFQDEYRELCRRYGIDLDERYAWD